MALVFRHNGRIETHKGTWVEKGAGESYSDVIVGAVNRSMTKSAAIVNTAMSIAIKACS